MFDSMDQWLMDKSERFAGWLQDLTGYDNFFLAKAAITLSCIILLSILIKFSVILSVIFFIIYILYIFDVYLLKKELSAEVVSETVANYLKDRDRLIRGINLGFLLLIGVLVVLPPYEVSGVFVLLSQAGLVAYKYFLCCDIKPASKSKIRQWVESWSTKSIDSKYD